MKSTLTIPKKCKVGFNERSDTYTGMLGYIIYHDGKVWRKETSWENWRYKYEDDETFKENKRKEYESRRKNYEKGYESTIASWRSYATQNSNSDYWNDIVKQSDTLEKYLNYCGVGSLAKFKYHPGNVSDNPGIIPKEFENVPTEGFVLNKKAGGGGRGWDSRQTVCRIYDPRGWEFEITIPNLLYILESTNSIKGKGLEGKFVYSWDGKDLVLLPEDAPEFQDIVAHNEMMQKSIKRTELVVGGRYKCADGNIKTYMDYAKEYDYHDLPSSGKKLWFCGDAGYYLSTHPIDHVKEYIDMDPDFANKMDKLEGTKGYKNPGKEFVKYTKAKLYALIPKDREMTAAEKERVDKYEKDTDVVNRVWASFYKPDLTETKYYEVFLPTEQNSKKLKNATLYVSSDGTFKISAYHHGIRKYNNERYDKKSILNVDIYHLTKATTESK